MKIKKIDQLWLVLKVSYGLYVLLAGINKFVPLLGTGDAADLLSPWVIRWLPVSLEQFLSLLGIVEILNGLLILSAYTYYGAYMLMGWLLLIVLNLVSMNAYYGIIINCLCHAAGCYVLAQLSWTRMTGKRL